MKGIDIVYHADNNTMELKDAPDDLLIGTDGDDYANYLKFQIIDDEGILDGFSPYVLFEVESRPMIGLDESYTLNLTQDILNKARYGKLPFMLVFKGKDSTIEIHSTNSLSLGIAHSIDADREVEDDTPDSELAIKYVEITYHAESRLMELTDMPDDQFVGTDGDDYATYLRFHMDDPDGLLTGYGARVEFDVSIKDENGDTYKPFIVIDETMTVPLIQRILSNVKYGAIPIQLAFKGTDSEGRSSQFYSLNKLRLSISDSIHALEGIDVNDRIDLNSVINNVEYNPKTATFSFRQIDGGTIAVQLSDLSEEHFEVSTKDDLKKLNKAQNGDTATTLDDGKWYKLYGEYSDSQSWIVMSPSVKAVDDHISDRDNPHNVTKSQIGLGNVDDTSDIDKPISTLTQEALDTKADSKDLSELSKIVSEEIADRESSDSAINESISNHVSDTNNPHNVTKEQLGLENVDNTSDVNKPISTATQEALDDKADKTMVSLLSNTLTKEIQDRQDGDNTNATAISTHATNKSNPHGVTKEQVGLGNVDNTSDADKPISTATQNALNLKADKTEISSLYRPKGSVATYNDLPSTAQIGDVYDVQSTGMNYVWTGSKWDELGAIIDLSPYYTKVDVDSALSGKVSKSGDTMTGNLGVKGDNKVIDVISTQITDQSGMSTNTTSNKFRIRSNALNTLSEYGMETNADRNKAYLRVLRLNGDTLLVKDIAIHILSDGTYFSETPSNFIGTNDNSDKTLTIKMANSLPSLLHSTGNETKNGTLTLTSSPKIKSTWLWFVNDTSYTGGIYSNYLPDSGYGRTYMRTYNGSGANVSIEVRLNDDGVAMGFAPTTPSGATSNEIATANWSIGKFVALSGDQTIGGIKTFSNNSLIQSGTNPTIQIANTSTASDPKNWCTLRMTIRNNNATNPSDLTITNINCYPTLTRTQLEMRAVHNNADGIEASRGSIYVIANSDGTSYANAPTPSDKADNSTKIATTSWTAQTSLLVHTTGNESIAGQKTFTGVCASTNFTLLGDESVGRQGMTFRNYGGASTPNSGILINNSTNYVALSINSSVDSPAIQIGHANVPAYAVKPPESAKGGEIVTANWSLGKFVQKTGDTMTGALTLQQSGWNNLTFKHTKYDVLNPSGGDERTLNICAYDVNTQLTTSLTTSNNTDYVRTYLASYGYKSDGTRVSSAIDIYANRDGTAYVLAPKPSSSSDNSTKIATTSWINSADVICRTVGNQTISGVKTFSGIVYLNTSYGNLRLNMHNLLQSSTPPTSRQVNYTAVKGLDKDGKESTVWQLETIQGTDGMKLVQLATNFVNWDDGTSNWYYPFRVIQRENKGISVHTITPSSNATGTEITTADWVLKKIASNDIHIGGDSTSGKWYRLATHPKVTPTYYDGHMMLAVWDNYLYNGYPVTRNGILNVHIRRANTSFNGNIRFTLAGADIQYSSYALVLYSDFSAEVYVKQTNSYGRPSATRINHNIDDNKWIVDDADTTSVDSLDGLGGTILYSQPPLIYTPEDKADNTAVPVNAKWVNTASSLVHTTQNETVDGTKTFSTPIIDPQNQSGYIGTPNSNSSANPYRKVASISMDNVSAWDTASLIFDVEWGWNAGEHHVCTFRASFSTNGDKTITRVLFSKIWSSGQAYSTVLNVDHWWLLHNATTKEVQIWMKNEYDQLNLNCRVRMSGRRHEKFANWKLHTSGASDGVASLPSTDDGWVIVNATDISNRMTFSTPSTATGQEIVTADWSLGKFVKKIGDTMSDNLAIAKGGVSSLILKRTDVNKDQSTYKQLGVIRAEASDGLSSQIEFLRNTPLGHLASGVIISAYNSTGTQQALSLYSFDEGVNQEAYVQHPSWKVGTNDNSDKSLTIKMANSLPSLCHSTGNETWSGSKSFTSNVNLIKSYEGQFLIQATSVTRGTIPSSDLSPGRFRVTDGANATFGEVYTSLGSDGSSSITLCAVKNQTSRADAYIVVGWKADGSQFATAPTTPTNATSNEIATANWVNTNFVKKTGGKVTEAIAFTGTVGNTQTEAGVYLGLDANGDQPNATISLVSENTATYIDMGAPNEDYGFRIIKWKGMNNNLAQFDYGGGGKITIPNASGTMALTSQIPVITASTTDIGEGSALATGTLYLVYE